jgi:hypothetical protein
MYLLDKCSVDGCTRGGYVALEEADTVCNIHKNAENNTKDEDEESEDE